MKKTYKITDKTMLENFVGSHWSEINEFIDKKFADLPTPIYSSVDIRESKFKFAPVDQNMYPAGFNNLCMFDLNVTSDHLKRAISNKNPDAKRIGIISESHTKNLFYLDHLYTLKTALERAGYDVFIISFDPHLFAESNTLSLISFSQNPVEIKRASIRNHFIEVDSTIIDFAILNNDQSSPLHVDWQTIQTPINPPPSIGWYQRQKIKHFTHYHQVVEDFCCHFSIDPNLLEAKYYAINKVDFSTKEGLEEVAQKVDQLQAQLPEPTPIFIKASQGTYGMGIHVVNSGQEVLELNRKKRNKLDIGKNRLKFTSVLAQEGIETVIKYNDTPAEVTIYLINGMSVGGFMRANPLRGTNENLNAKGMVYQKFCISEIRDNSDHKAKEALYSTIARLSTLAGALEIQEIQNIEVDKRQEGNNEELKTNHP